MIFLAPMQGYTDFIFRNVYSRYYTGVDIAVSPFISLIDGKTNVPRVAKDVLPANNRAMPVIPQILGNNPEQFIAMAKKLAEWGYNSLNWNMGCPVKNTTRKKRGSGLLPHPGLVREILEEIIPNIPQRLSVKVRLGLIDTDEIYQLIPVLNDFPLEYVVIHPRVGIQMYEGKVYHDVLTDCLPLLKQEVVYNGDIYTLADYRAVEKKYPSIQKWMIGRGVLYNPLLPAIIKGKQLPSNDENVEIFLSFLLDLYSELQIYKNEEQLMPKVKDFWKLFSKRFVRADHVFSQISHTMSIDEVIVLTKKLIAEEMMNDWNVEPIAANGL